MTRYLIGLWLFCAAVLMANPADEAAELKRLESAITDLQENRGDVLFPEAFRKIQNELRSFHQHLNDLTPVDRSVQATQLITELQSWIAAAERIRPNLIPLLDLRDRVQLVDAYEFARNPFQEADLALNQAATDFLRNANGDAKNQVRRAERFYLQAEREAIRNSLLGQVRILLLESEDLDAKTYSPKSLQTTRRLLALVERQVERPEDQAALSRNSLDLLKMSRQLLRRVKILNTVYADPANGEDILLAIEAETEKAAGQLDLKLVPEASLAEQLSSVNLSLETLRTEEDLLQAQLGNLNQERVDLETELKQYRSNRDWSEATRQKVARLKEELGDVVREDGGFLTLTLSPFRFADDVDQLNANHQAELLPLISALQIFPQQTILVRYFQSAIGGSDYGGDLANRRAEAIEDFLRAKNAAPDQQIKAMGINLVPDSPLSQIPQDYLQIMIDMETVLGYSTIPSSGNTE
ncbi:MAG: OmpA family protein [Calditrichaeota bacterium]|nr:OmpA family protein [Calditrichota bacterium]